MKEAPVKGYFKNEAKFLLMWLLGVPLVLVVVGLIVTLVMTHRQ
jgi:hypothetical protein